MLQLENLDINNLQKVFSQKLLKWYSQNARELPWRKTKNPYHIYVSEIMLQQTQVVKVIPYFNRFIERFPDILALAESSEQEVLSLWSGLGYYSRAKNLRKSATIIASDHHGKVPKNKSELMALPGIGEYTSGAILSIAYNQDEPILDGNVIRVLSRFFQIIDPVGTSQTKKRLWQLARDLIPTGEASDFNQALMELGALICSPFKGNTDFCSKCPVNQDCLARKNGKVSELPNLPMKRKKENVYQISCLIVRNGKFLLVRRNKKELLDNMWELPSGGYRKLSQKDKKFSDKDIKDYLMEEIVIIPEQFKYLATHSHSITYRTIKLLLYFVDMSESDLDRYISDNDCQWVVEKEIDHLPHSSLLRKMIPTIKLNLQY